MKYRCFVSTLACLLVTVTSASTLDALLDDPAAAESFDYCDWRSSVDGTPTDLPDFPSILDDEVGPADESRRRAAALADAGTRIALAADNARSCAKTFSSGLKAHRRSHERALKSFRGAAVTRVSDDPTIAEVQVAITDLWAKDQVARRVYVASRTDDETGARFWARRLAFSLATAADEASTSYIKQQLDRYDWIDAHRFGDRIASHAWLLVQHADDHPELQQRVLTRMEKYLADGGVKRSNYAYLWDRVAVNHGRKQRYGTQPDWGCKDGRLTLRAIEDPDNVDARRAEMQLGPVQEQLDRMSREVCGAGVD